MEKETKLMADEILGSFHLGTNELALPVKYIQEVVNPPEKLNSMPLAPAFLLGVFNLRGSIIPVVDLKNLLGLKADQNPLTSKKIGIIDHGGMKIGLLFDRTGEIFRNLPEQQSDFTYANAESTLSVICGAIKLEEGKRIVQIIDVHALARLENLPMLSRSTDQAAQERRTRNLGTRKQCISFVVGEGRCAFGIEVIHEIIKVPEIKESTLSFRNCVGTFELRGDVVPVIDFGALLKYRPVISRENIAEDQRIVIMKFGQDKFGLLIDAVESIITYYSEELLGLPVLGQEKMGMFVGCLSKPGLEDTILLNHERVFSDEEIVEITRGHSKIFQSASSKHQEEKKRRGARKSYISFRLDHLMALGIEEVREIIDLPQKLLTPPGLPHAVRGMLNLRGKIVTILDARTLYQQAPANAPNEGKVLIFERVGVSYGMVVDAVENILSFSEDEQIKLPEILYKGGEGISEDVKCAVEIVQNEERTTLLILNLDPLVQRVSGPRVIPA